MYVCTYVWMCVSPLLAERKTKVQSDRIAT